MKRLQKCGLTDYRYFLFLNFCIIVAEDYCLLNNPTILKEKELFLRIADGEEQAFNELFRIYLPQIHRHIYQIVRSETAAKDIIQEVFLHLWLGRYRLPEVDNPSAWIFRIAYNQSFSYLKKQSYREKSQNTIENIAEEKIASRDTEEALDLSEINQLIQKAVRELPPQSRRIFQLNRLNGIKPAEIAEELQISVQAVRNALTRSGKFIRDHLAKNGIFIPQLLLFFCSL